jgi:hypothetical protein
MIKYIISVACISFFFASCTSPDIIIDDSMRKHNYRLSNDSLEQSLELFSMDDSTIQFTLRIENKYLDTLDSYMSHAKSADGKHFIHNRNNCNITFELTGSKKDTAVLTACNCPELTVQGLNAQMPTDTTHIIVFR